MSYYIIRFVDKNKTKYTEFQGEDHYDAIEAFRECYPNAEIELVGEVLEGINFESEEE